ncbi:MAG TPA: tetratricopeptide repeat protein [Myxococcales bacterium]|jgi:hypothetical protein|nr:tetratricopeptide repeat protein [Myxococcales bacterium]
MFPARAAALLLAAAAVAQPKPAERPPQDGGPERAAPAPGQQDWMARADELYKTRDQGASQKEIGKILREQLSKDPNSFEANWRLSQLLAFQANGMPDGSEVKAAVGKAGWQAGDLAVASRGDDVRGQYWAAVGIGLYSEGVGILTALGQGLEGKFRGRAQAAMRLDPDYLDGSPVVLWGRYFYKLPWPKKNVDESVKVLSAAVKSHPTNLRAKLYLADSIADNGRKDEAKKLLQEVIEAPMQDPPDDKRNKEWARQRSY